MQLTLEPLLAMEVMSLFFLVTGKPAMDLRPVNGATACAGEARLTVVTAVEEIIEAISSFFFLGCTTGLCASLLIFQGSAQTCYI